MKEINVVLFKKENGEIPVQEWLDSLPVDAMIKCISVINHLHKKGYQLRRPIAAYLGNGIYELRIIWRHIQFRILYFFHGQEAVILSHGIEKKREVPKKEISKAITYKEQYLKNPNIHTHKVNIQCLLKK